MTTKVKSQTSIVWSKLIVAIILPFIAAGIGSIFTSSAIPNWYATLDKPVFNPPNWVFGPVWSVLYLLQGIAFYYVLVSKAGRAKIKDASTLFIAQLIANVFWSIIFFGMELPWLALVDILVLWALIFMTIRSFQKIRPVAGYLLWPYLAWVSFATVLNLAIALLN